MDLFVGKKCKFVKIKDVNKKAIATTLCSKAIAYFSYIFLINALYAVASVTTKLSYLSISGLSIEICSKCPPDEAAKQSFFFIIVS